VLNFWGPVCISHLLLLSHDQELVLLHHLVKEGAEDLLGAQDVSLLAVLSCSEKLNTVIFGHYKILDELILRVAAQCLQIEVKVELALNTLAQVFLFDALGFHLEQCENGLYHLRELLVAVDHLSNRPRIHLLREDGATED